jgi:integrase
VRLTRPALANLALPPGRSDLIVFDDTLPGFGVRIRAGGKRVWIAQYRMGQKQRRVTIGSVETIDPDQARRAAKSILAKVHLGSDPQATKTEAKARAHLTLGAMIEPYLEFASRRLKARTLVETNRYLRTSWKPLHSLAIEKITRRTIALQLSELTLTNGPIAANRARIALSSFFTWAMREGLADTNPVVGTNRPTEERSRDRVLTNYELARIWAACRDDDYGRIVRLLILTGQRREEVGGMAWSELDLQQACWSIPRDRTKNSLPHDVPLSKAAIEVLQDCPRREGRQLVFGEAGGPFQGWSKAKAALDKRILESGRQIPAWRLHDIRRTVATRMAELGTLPHVVEAVLNHISGHKSGVAGVYNRASYSQEKRQALDMWATHVGDIVALYEGGQTMPALTAG